MHFAVNVRCLSFLPNSFTSTMTIVSAEKEYLSDAASACLSPPSQSPNLNLSPNPYRNVTDQGGHRKENKKARSHFPEVSKSKLYYTWILTRIICVVGVRTQDWHPASNLMSCRFVGESLSNVNWAVGKTKPQYPID